MLTSRGQLPWFHKEVPTSYLIHCLSQLFPLDFISTISGYISLLHAVRLILYLSV